MSSEGSQDETYHDLPARANLGCGNDYRGGWHNVDVRPRPETDERVDLDKRPWPWPDNSFEHVLMDNVIEHMDSRLETLHELHRVVETGGTVALRFPHWNSAGHYSCPSHTKTLTHRSFENPEVDHLFDVRGVDCTPVRMGRLLTPSAALWMADHVGQIVSEVEVTLEVTNFD